MEVLNIKASEIKNEGRLVLNYEVGSNSLDGLFK